MKFANGMFGACICVIALLGTAIGGFVLNVEEDTREVTKYNQIADVSGLFTYEDAPEYIAYNPSSNYVGYSGNVNYTPSPTANNYRYVAQQGSVVSNTLTISDSSDYPGDYGTANFFNGTDGDGNTILPDTRALWNGSINFGSPGTYHGKQFNWGATPYGTGDSRTAHITKLTSVLNSIPDYGTYESVDITIAYNTTYPVMFYAGGWQLTEVDWNGGILNYYWTELNEGNTMPDRITVNIASNQATAYRGGNVIWQTTTDKVGVCAWYWELTGGSPNPVTCSATLSYTARGYATYGYMQPSAGVTLNSVQGTAIWENGYENSVIDLKVVKNGDRPLPQSLRIMFDPNSSMLYKSIYLDWEIPHGFRFTAYGGQVILDRDIGQWLAIQVRIDALSGKVTLTPTNNTDLMQTVAPNDTSIVLDNFFTPGTLDNLHFSGRNHYNSLKFQVTDTMVFLNTYNTVMVNPTLQISDYFPSYEDYRLNFYSFAILGESMTINGQPCPVNKDNGTITFENVAGFTFTKKLENLYVTFNEGRTYLTFVNDDSTYDLGETTDTRISFSGMWYFTTGLYEITTGTENYWNWDLSGFQATAGECLIIFLGIIAVGIIAYTVYGKGKLGLFDWLVIIFAVFIGSAMLGF